MRLPKLESVRTRLLLWNIGVMALLLAVLGVIIHVTVQRNLLAAVDNSLLARRIGGPGPAPGPGPGQFPGPGGPPPDGFGTGGAGQPGGPGGPPPGGFGPGSGGGQQPQIFGSPPGQPPRNSGPQGGGFPLQNDPGDHGPNAVAPVRPPRRPFNNEGGPRQFRNFGGPGFPPFGAIMARGDASRPLDAPRLYPLKLNEGALAAVGAPWDIEAYKRAVAGEIVLSTVKHNGMILRLVTRPFMQWGHPVAVIQFAYPLADALAAIQEMNQVLLTLLPVGLLLAALGGAAVTNRALRPVRTLEAGLRRLTAEDLGSKLPEHGNDEFARLTGTCNELLARLYKAFTVREELLHQQQELIEQQKRFTADASHELKTPLTVIMANTGILLRDNDLPEAVREAVADMDLAAGVMRKLVQDLLLLARFDTQNGVVAHEPMLVADIFREAIRRGVRQCEAVITSEVSPPDLQVSGSFDDLVRLYSNLLDNACRFTEANGTVHLSAQATDDGILTRVSDTGSGIAPEHLPHLGERFYRVDSSRTRTDGGTGLGLSICRSICESHHGIMTIESEQGIGTTINVTLPI